MMIRRSESVVIHQTNGMSHQQQQSNQMLLVTINASEDDYMTIVICSQTNLFVRRYKSTVRIK